MKSNTWEDGYLEIGNYKLCVYEYKGKYHFRIYDKNWFALTGHALKATDSKEAYRQCVEIFCSDKW